MAHTMTYNGNQMAEPNDNQMAMTLVPACPKNHLCLSPLVPHGNDVYVCVCVFSVSWVFLWLCVCLCCIATRYSAASPLLSPKIITLVPAYLEMGDACPGLSGQGQSQVCSGRVPC